MSMYKLALKAYRYRPTIITRMKCTTALFAAALTTLMFFLMVCLRMNAELNGETNSSDQQNLKTMRIDRFRPAIDCARLFEDDPTEQHKAELYQESHSKWPISNREYTIRASSDCDRFIADQGYITEPRSDEEREFPLAFDLLVFKDIEQFDRLLRAIYRSHNFYCVHVDKKAESSFHKAIEAIVGCFKNVFVLRNNIEVTWGTFSVLEPDILCMKALLQYKKWKYFINLTGQEFPLKTNWELVQILKALNGSNIVAGSLKNNFPKRRVGRPPPPLGVTPSKGPVHISVRREFVEYVVNDARASLILNWTRLVDVPDETFFTTLNHNPKLGIPGSYLGEPGTNWKKYPFLNRYKIWNTSNVTCHGKYHHNICIFGIGDLPLLAKSRRLFANKFHLDYQPLALDCMEELIRNRTLKEIEGRREFNTSYYSALEMARNHL